MCRVEGRTDGASPRKKRVRESSETDITVASLSSMRKLEKLGKKSLNY